MADEFDIEKEFKSEAPGVEEVAEELTTPAAEEPSTTEEVVEELETPKEETPVEEPPAAEEPAEEEEVDELTALKEQNAKLLAMMEQFAEGKLAVAEPKKPVTEAAPATIAEVKEAIKDEVMEFLGPNDDIDEILANKSQTNTLLLKVLKAAKPDVEQLKTSIRQEILTTLPQVVLAQVQQQITLKKTVDDFMGAHEKLQPVRKTVGIIASQVASEHPEFTLEEVLKESAQRAYTTLGIKQGMVKRQLEKGGDKPSFVDTKGTRQKVGGTKSAIQREIEELLD